MDVGRREYLLHKERVGRIIVDDNDCRSPLAFILGW